MLLVHLITALRSGGTENHLEQFVLASDRRRFRHIVVSLVGGGEIASELKEAGIEVHSLGMKRGLPSVAGMVRLVRLLRRIKPDLLHCWLYHACLMGLLGGRLAGVPRLIWTIQSANPGLHGYKFLTRAVVRCCALLSFVPDAIVVNSGRGEAVHQDFGFQTAKLKVIPSGIDVERLCPNPQARTSVRTELGVKPDSVLVGMIARFHPVKDHPTFLRAAALVHRQYPDLNFLFAGEGMTADNQALLRLVNENGLQQVVYLLGTRRDVPRLTAALDVACLSSWSESSPFVIGEAMACGVPCVVTDVGDSAYIVADTGLAVPPRDPAALANGIMQLILAGREHRQKLGEAARRRIESEFSLPEIARRYEDLYRKHLQD